MSRASKPKGRVTGRTQLGCHTCRSLVLPGIGLARPVGVSKTFSVTCAVIRDPLQCGWRGSSMRSARRGAQRCRSLQRRAPPLRGLDDSRARSSTPRSRLARKRGQRSFGGATLALAYMASAGGKAGYIASRSCTSHSSLPWSHHLAGHAGLMLLPMMALSGQEALSIPG